MKSRLVLKPGYGSLDPSKLNFSVDWCHGWLPVTDVRSFLDDISRIDARLSLEFFSRNNKSILNWMIRFDLLGTGIIIAWNQDPSGDFFTALSENLPGFNQGIFFSIPGDGLRFLGDYTVHSLFSYLIDKQFVCTRIDLACDIFDPLYAPMLNGVLDAFDHVVNYVEGDPTIQTRVPRSLIHTKIQSWNNIDPYRSDRLVTRNLSFGSTASRLGKYRLYDKWLELRSGRLSSEVSQDKALLDFLDSNQFWYRMEYAISKSRSVQIFNSLLTTSLSDLFVYAAESFFTPVEARSYGYQLSECDPLDSWFSFLSECGVAPNIHFVQLLFMGNSVDRTLSYLDKMHTTLIKYEILRQRAPSFFDSFFASHVPATLSDPLFRRWLSDLNIDLESISL